MACETDNGLLHAFDCMADIVSYSTKAEADRDFALIQKRTKIMRLNERRACMAVQMGYAIRPGVLEGGSSANHWMSQQLFGVDIDNKDEATLDPLDALQRAYDAGLPPMALYFTMRSTLERPRFRILFLADESTDDRSKAEKIIAGLLTLYPEADRKCTNVDRIWLGSNGEVWECWKQNEGKLCDVSLMASLAPKPEPVQPDRKRVPRLLRPLREGEVDLDEVKAAFDLLGLIQLDTGECGRRSGRRIGFKTCPICGHHDCFSYYESTNSYTCFSESHEGNGGTVIDYLMERDKIGYQEAKRALGVILSERNNRG